MSAPRPLDLLHLGFPGAISAYLVLEPEPTLVDPGPSTTLPNLREALAAEGLGPGDLRRVLLTHIHLDHAGAAGHLAGESPSLQVHVHRDGAPHLADPTRLVASTRRTFGDAHDRLWGEVHPVPPGHLHPLDPEDPDGVTGFRAIPTPGHIAHHLAWLHEGSGVLLAGDALGINLVPGASTHPPTPPPAVDLVAWDRTLTDLAALDPPRFGAAHFGLQEGFHERREQLRQRLRVLGERVARALGAGDLEDGARYEEEVRREQARFLPRERVDRYFDTFPARTDWEGVRHYLERRGGGGR